MERERERERERRRMDSESSSSSLLASASRVTFVVPKHSRTRRYFRTPQPPREQWRRACSVPICRQSTCTIPIYCVQTTSSAARLLG